MIPAQAVNKTSTTQKLPLGTRYFDETTGKTYYYIKANAAIVEGDTLTSIVALFDGDCDASSGSILNDAAVTFTAATVGCYVKVNAGTNSIDDVPNRVTAYSANALTLENGWSAALTTAEDYIVYNPFLVKKSDSVGQIITGVGVTSIATGEYGWMQSGGYCHAVKVIGGTDAVVANEGVVSSSTAGTCKGLTAAGTTADEAEKSNITAILPTALTQKAPAYLRCLP